MIDEEEKRLRAYQIWESEGRPEGRDLAHWYQAADVEASATGEGAHYIPYSAGAASAGSLVIKFYQSGDQVRGYVRKIARPGKTIRYFLVRRWSRRLLSNWPNPTMEKAASRSSWS